MGNDLLKQLEDKINEAIDTIELSRMEVSDLKEQNEELENRYADWETRLSALIEKFEQLEHSEDVELEAKENTDISEIDEDSEEELETSDSLDLEEKENVEAEVVEALDQEVIEDEFSDEEELGSSFGTNSDSFTEATESSQHYA